MVKNEYGSRVYFAIFVNIKRLIIMVMKRFEIISPALLFLAILHFGLSGCKRESRTSAIPTVVIDPEARGIALSTSAIFSQMKVVPLETHPDALVHRFHRLIHLDHRNIILESYNTILVFDANGKYLSKVDAVGKAGHEYETISSSFVDADRQEIYVVDYQHIKVFGYNGKHLRTARLPRQSGGLYRRDDGSFVVVAQQIYKEENRDALYLLDSAFNLIKAFKSANPDVCQDRQNLVFSGNPYERDGRLFFKEPFVDTLYEITGDTLKPYWYFDMQGRGIATKDFINAENSEKVSNTKIAPLGPQEIGSCFFIRYQYKRGHNFSIFDKNRGEYVFHKRFTRDDFPRVKYDPILGMDNDLIDALPRFWPDYVGNDTVAGLLSPASLDKTQLKAFHVKMDDNPIVVIGVLKK